MIKSASKKLVIAGLMLITGILLPFFASHGIGLFPGNVLLPMHIPVLLCGFFCGPFYGGACGFLLPYFNYMLTGMPAIYPNAVVMSFELLTYGTMCAVMSSVTKHSYKLRHIYPALIISLIAGRIVYGLAAGALLFFNPDMKKMSVIAAAAQGLPGIIIQLAVIPKLVSAVAKSISHESNAKESAVQMIKNGDATCVLVKNNRIVSAESPKGIAYILDLYDKGMLDGVFVADTIIGKAAAMLFSHAGVKACYGRTVSRAGLEWLETSGISVTYDECTDMIQNRKGDGMCPMESTVNDIFDEEEAIEALKNKVKELQKL